MGSNGVKFSLIVPVYNVEQYLEKCLESLINQNFSNIEIIVINDGSTDNSPLICDKYERKDSRIRVFHKENGGLSDTRNFGISKAVGEYIIFVDSDDHIKHNTCAYFKEIIDYNNGVDVIASNLTRVGNTLPTEVMYTNCDSDKNLKGSEFLKIQLRNNSMHMASCRNIYRRKFLIDNQLYFKKGILHEDEHWTPRVFLNAESVICTDFVFYYHNIRQGSITQQKVKTKNALDLISTCKELKIKFEKIEDKELKLLLFDYLVIKFFHAFLMGRLLGRKYKNVVNKDFLKDMAYSKKNRMRVSFFSFSRYLYYFYYYLRMNYLSK